MINVLWRRPVRLSRRGMHTLSTSSTFAARRATSRNPMTWRKLTTLFYSTIIATTAAADAKVKIARREELDSLIADTENDIQNRKSRTDNAFLNELEAGLNLNSERITRVRKIHTTWRKDSDEKLDSVWSEKVKNRALRDMDRHRRKQHRAGTRADVTDEDLELMKDLLLKNGILAKDAMSQAVTREVAAILTNQETDQWYPELFASRSPSSMYASRSLRATSFKSWTWKKAATVELSMARLAKKLYLKAQMLGKDRVHVSRTQAELSAYKADFKQLWSCSTHDLGDYFGPALPAYDLEMDIRPDIFQQRNRLLLDLFKCYAQKEISLQRLYLNLSSQILSSRTPPDISFLTILISRFTQAQQFEPAGFVVEALFSSHIKMNEMAAGAILSYYTHAGDLEGFERFLDRMEGSGSRALMLSKPRSNPQQYQDSSDGQPGKARKNHQLIRMSLPLYKTIITGYLKLGELNGAISVLSWMNDRLVSGDATITNSFLRFFAVTRNWQGGSKVWSVIKQDHLPAWSEEMPLCLPNSTEHKSYQWYNKLCIQCDQAEALEEVVHFARERGLRKANLEIDKTDRAADVVRIGAGSLGRKLGVIVHKITLSDIDIRNYAARVMASKVILEAPSIDELRKEYLSSLEGSDASPKAADTLEEPEAVTSPATVSRYHEISQPRGGEPSQSRESSETGLSRYTANDVGYATRMEAYC